MPRSNPPQPDAFGIQQSADMQAAAARMLETLSELGSEVTAFIANRVKDDLQTQHDLLACKTSADFLHVQAQFVQRAINQYTDETGKMVALNASLLNRLLHPSGD